MALVCLGLFGDAIPSCKEGVEEEEGAGEDDDGDAEHEWVYDDGEDAADENTASDNVEENSTASDDLPSSFDFDSTSDSFPPYLQDLLSNPDTDTEASSSLASPEEPDTYDDTYERLKKYKRKKSKGKKKKGKHSSTVPTITVTETSVRAGSTYFR